MKYLSLFLLIAGLAAFSGCTTPSARNVENSKQLRAGMSKSKVLEIMGEPLTEEEYNTPDVWYYYIETVWVDGLTTRDECMPVVFENGKLVGWGNRFYTKYRSSGVRNAREIKLTGDGVPVQEKAKEEETKAKEEVKAKAPEVKAPEVKKADPKPADNAGKVTVEDLITEMDSKK